MRYWWVNHSQTFDQELNSGYLWSPKANKDGSRNQFYMNMTIISEGDFVFSYSERLIKAIGIVISKAFESTRPNEFGNVGEQWNREGWTVKTDWQLLDKPFSPIDHIEIIREYLPSKYSPIRKNGDGNQGCYLASISKDLARELTSIADIQDIIQTLPKEKESKIKEQKELSRIQKSHISLIEKQQLINARVGQGDFRKNLIDIENECRLTHVDNYKFLIASHIKPWRDSSDEEKLDGNNGFLLSPHVDKLFDGGYISFTDDGKILRASTEIDSILKKWGLDPNMNIGEFNRFQKNYLKYHRDNIFREGT